MQLLRPEAALSSGAIPTPDEAIRRPARTGLTVWLLLLAAMLTLPLLGVAVAALLRDHDNARRRSEDQLVMQARALAFTVDSQLATAAAVARTLAHSVLLARGDLVSFRTDMDAAAATLPGALITLVSRQAHQMLTTRLPPGEVVPPGTLATASIIALGTGRDTISDLFVAVVTKRVNLAITALVPAPGDAAATDPGSVSVVLHADSFVPMLQAQAHAPGWVAMLADRQLRIVGRSENAEQFTYLRRVPPEVAAAQQLVETGVARVVRPNGVVALDAFARAPVSGYLVVIGMPESELAETLSRSLLAVVAVAAPVILLGFGLALWLGRLLARAIGGLALPEGQTPKGLHFREVDRIAERLASAERWRLVLMQEMNHRVKNTLMTVQAVASQTLRSAEGDPELFRQTFMARLATLARALDLLTATTSHGAAIEDTLRAGLAPWLEAGTHTMRLTVRHDFHCNARQTQALILALHELGTNAAKYGALTRPGGSVTLDCAMGPDGVAVLFWQEAGGPEVPPTPRRRGFGSRLLDVILPQDLGLGATVRRELAPDGLRACIRFRPMAPNSPGLLGPNAGAPVLRTAQPSGGRKVRDGAFRQDRVSASAANVTVPL